MALTPTAAGRLAAGMAATSSDGDLADWIERHAAALLAGNNVTLLPHLPRLLAVDDERRPWLRLVVATTLFARDARDPLPWRMLRDAAAAFRRAGDLAGYGCALYTEGNWSITIGDIPAATRLWEEGRVHLDGHLPAYAHSLANQAWSAYGTGDLVRARTLGEEAVAVAVRHGDARALGTAYTHLSAYEIWLGSFTRASVNLAGADRAFAEISEGVQRYEWPIALVMAGAVEALRGRWPDAHRRMDHAVVAADETGSAWIRGIVHAIRADVSAVATPLRSLADADVAVEALTGVDERWWMSWARVASGRALGAAGHRHAAARTIERVIAEAEVPPVERARHLMLLGEQVVDTDPARARDLITEAIAGFERCGAAYWTGHAWSRLALADGSRAARHWERARAVAPSDPAATYMLRELATLRVSFFTGPAVLVGATEVRFPTRHALYLLLALAAHAPDGVRAERLGGWLWPDATREVAAHRLKNAVWQVRSHLGAAGGRLYRRGDRVLLDVTGDECDLLALTRRAESLLRGVATEAREVRATIDGLRRPLLDVDGAEWASELGERCAGLAARLATRFPTFAG
ncbi:hypothetical protein AB0I61_12780 [Polymorphospora rubra]|uniref:hypothetical protein n=1 Tax=Polymorphospora rubra TaxID=338584 RepID=UPI0033D52436